MTGQVFTMKNEEIAIVITDKRKVKVYTFVTP